MEILYGNGKLEKQCSDQIQLAKKYGSDQARAIRRHLDNFIDADTLEDIRILTQARCHELKGDRQGTLAVDLKHPYRLVFEPANEPIPTKEAGGLDWKKVTVIRILEIKDYHG